MFESFPPWRTVYRWFARLRDDCTWETINHYLAPVCPYQYKFGIPHALLGLAA